jgi:hypothetical protein
MEFYDSCDESKYVSKGNSESFGGSFTCYGDDDGFVSPQDVRRWLPSSHG